MLMIDIYGNNIEKCYGVLIFKMLLYAFRFLIVCTCVGRALRLCVSRFSHTFVFVDECGAKVTRKQTTCSRRQNMRQ
jgi:hypothetical protein